LGKLCKDLSIAINGRHRAEGDAFATAQLFNLLLKKDNDGVINRSKNIDELFSRSKKNSIHPLAQKVPEATGIYYFYDSSGNIIYIGKSLNIRQRVIQHLGNVSSKKALNMANSIHDVSYELTGSELIALLLESHEIKKYKPVFNRALTRSSFTFGIHAAYDHNGYLCLNVSKNNVASSDPIISFVNAEEARNFLYAAVEKYSLCQKLCGLYDGSKACFHYQVKKCDGACVGEESAERYNEKVKELVAEYQFSKEDFFVIDEGRAPTEVSVVKIFNGKYCGFGFANAQEEIKDPSQLEACVRYFEDNRDVRSILRNYIASRKMKQLIRI
jgi:DNA polymerase-3 subunit epsilon